MREVVAPCLPVSTWAPPTLTPPPLSRVTLAARQLHPAWMQRVGPGPDGRQWPLSAVLDVALEAPGVQADRRISFPYPLLIQGGSHLPDGHELVCMFAYRLVSGHWWVRTEVAGIRKEATVTTGGVVWLNVVTGSEKRKPEWVDVARLAMHVHVGRKQKGRLDVIDVEGEEEPSPRQPLLKAESPAPPPKGTPMPLPWKAPRTGTPAERGSEQSGRHGTGRGGVHMWMIGWSSSSSNNSSSGGRGRSPRSARRPPTATLRPAYLGPTRTGGPPRRSWRPSPGKGTASPPG